MKFKKLVAALSAVTMLGSLAVAVPASAEETPVVAKVTKEDNTGYTVKASKEATNEASQNISSYAIYLGEVSAKDAISLTINLTSSNLDLSAIGLYACQYREIKSYSSTITDDSAADVMKNGVALQAMTCLKPDSNITAWPFKDEAHGNINSTYEHKGFTGEMSLQNTPADLTYTGVVPEEVTDGSRLYIVIASWTKKQSGADQGPNSKGRTLAANKITTNISCQTLEGAVKATTIKDNNATIELQDNVALSDRIILKNIPNIVKEFTIQGNGHIITAPENKTLAIEVSNGYNVTLDNVTVTGGTTASVNAVGGGVLAVKGNSILGDENSVGLSVGGFKDAYNVKIDNSTVYTVKLSGKVDLIGTSEINNVIVAGKYTDNDFPEIKIGSDAKVSGQVTLDPKITESNVKGNTLLTGSVENAKVTYDGETLTIENGVFVEKSTSHNEAFTFNETADVLGADAKIYITFKSDKGTTREYAPVDLGTDFKGGGSAKIAVVVENIATGYSVQSITIK